MNTNEDLRARRAQKLKSLRVALGNARLLTGEEIAAFDYAIAALARQEEGREAVCSSCDGTGDVHRADGEWIGKCACTHPAPPSGGEDADELSLRVRAMDAIIEVTKQYPDTGASIASYVDFLANERMRLWEKTRHLATPTPQSEPASPRVGEAPCKCNAPHGLLHWPSDQFPWCKASAPASPQAAGVSELVPSWRDRAERSIPDGPDSKWHEGARDGMLQCAAELEHALIAAGAAPEGFGVPQPAPASPQGVSEVVERVLAKWEQLAADCVTEAQRQSDPRLAREIARDAGQYRACIGGMRDALKRYTAAGAAPEGCITVQRGAVNALLQFGTCHEMSSEAELHTYVEARDLLLNMLAAAPNPDAQHGQEGRDG